MFSILRTKRLATATFIDDISSSVEMALTKSIDHVRNQNFTDRSSTESPNNATIADNDKRAEWGQKLEFWSVPVTLGVIALIVICVLILFIESRRRSFQSREENSTLLQNTTPRSSISTILKATSQGNTDWTYSLVMQSGGMATSLDGEEADAQEAPKDTLVNSLLFAEAPKSQQSDETKEQILEMMTYSLVPTFFYGLEKITKNITK